MKSACPWDPMLSPNRWEVIERAMYSNSMLLATAEVVPRLISGIPDKVSHFTKLGCPLFCLPVVSPSSPGSHLRTLKCDGSD